MVTWLLWPSIYNFSYAMASMLFNCKIWLGLTTLGLVLDSILEWLIGTYGVGFRFSEALMVVIFYMEFFPNYPSNRGSRFNHIMISHNLRSENIIIGRDLRSGLIIISRGLKSRILSSSMVRGPNILSQSWFEVWTYYLQLWLEVQAY